MCKTHSYLGSFNNFFFINFGTCTQVIKYFLEISKDTFSLQLYLLYVYLLDDINTIFCGYKNLMNMYL